MKKYSLIFAIWIISSYSYAQYCVSGGPTSTSDSELGAISLTGASTSINIGLTCPGVLGVENLTASQSANLIAGNNYSLSVQFSDCGNGGFSGAGQAWIDFDLNQTFSAGESIGTWSGNPPSTKIFSFTVPATACNGTSRLRVIQEESGTLPLDPCASFTWGSVMDFGIVLSGGSCLVSGCTDPTASNYNPNATIDDGSCSFGNPQDCIGAIPLCLDFFEEENSYIGVGDIDEDLGFTSCMPSEVNSVWYTFTTPSLGNLAFTIIPNVFSDDYDWAVYDITGSTCDAIGTNGPVCCNYSGDDGPTGANSQGTGCDEGGGGSPFCGPMAVDSNHTYVICITNFSESINGYSINFSESTANVYADYIDIQKEESCNSDSIQLKVKYDGAIFGGLRYLWQPVNQFYDSSAAIAYTRLIVEDSIQIFVDVKNGPCTFKDSVYVKPSKILANFGWGFEDNQFSNDVEFTDSSKNANKLTWLFEPDFSLVTAAKINPNHEFPEPGYYTVTQIAENLELDCIDSISKSVYMGIPNIFTPNGDGINDFFIAKGVAKNSSLTVFNRWGKKVFYIEDGYDGTWDGGDLPDGMYHYVVEEPGSKGTSYKGWLQISR